jgi:hypothetical protein
VFWRPCRCPKRLLFTISDGVLGYMQQYSVCHLIKYYFKNLLKFSASKQHCESLLSFLFYFSSHLYPYTPAPPSTPGRLHAAARRRLPVQRAGIPFAVPSGARALTANVLPPKHVWGKQRFGNGDLGREVPQPRPAPQTPSRMAVTWREATTTGGRLGAVA